MTERGNPVDSGTVLPEDVTGIKSQELREKLPDLRHHQIDLPRVQPDFGHCVDDIHVITELKLSRTVSVIVILSDTAQETWPWPCQHQYGQSDPMNLEKYDHNYRAILQDRCIKIDLNVVQGESSI